MPKLRSMVESRGLFVALDLRTFNEAHAEIMSEASRLGALRLSGLHLDALIEWSQAALLDAAVKADVRVIAYDTSMRDTRADLDRWEAQYG